MPRNAVDRDRADPQPLDRPRAAARRACRGRRTAPSGTGSRPPDPAAGRTAADPTGSAPGAGSAAGLMARSSLVSAMMPPGGGDEREHRQQQAERDSRIRCRIRSSTAGRRVPPAAARDLDHGGLRRPADVRASGRIAPPVAEQPVEHGSLGDVTRHPGPAAVSPRRPVPDGRPDQRRHPGRAPVPAELRRPARGRPRRSAARRAGSASSFERPLRRRPRSARPSLTSQPVSPSRTASRRPVHVEGDGGHAQRRGLQHAQPPALALARCSAAAATAAIDRLLPVLGHEAVQPDGARQAAAPRSRRPATAPPGPGPPRRWRCRWPRSRSATGRMQLGPLVSDQPAHPDQGVLGRAAAAARAEPRASRPRSGSGRCHRSSGAARASRSRWTARPPRRRAAGRPAAPPGLPAAGRPRPARAGNARRTERCARGAPRTAPAPAGAGRTG